MKLEETFRKGGGIVRQFRKNVIEYTRIVNDPKRVKDMKPEDRLEELANLNRMLTKLYEMQEAHKRSLIKAVTKKEDVLDLGDEKVVISKGADAIPIEKTDPDSLVNSPEYKDILKGMPAAVVVREDEEIPAQMKKGILDDFFPEES